jgi:hypothetical protein
MNKIIKNMPVFFLWLAWLVITAHQIIPHDHHLADTYSNQEDSCPVSNSKTGHHHGFPYHCHAFNDLASEKATTYVLQANIQTNDVLISGFPDIFVFELQVTLTTISNIRKFFPDFYLLELSPLRAPPSLS